MNSTYYNFDRPEVAKLITGKPFRILEIGCGTGTFRQNLCWPSEYWGIEPVPEVAALAQQVLDRVFCGTYSEVKKDLPENYFDLVVCNDVIEHMVDPWSFLKSIQRKVHSTGQIVGSVPNVRYMTNLYGLLVKKAWNYSSAGILDVSHMRFFTPNSLKRTLIETGWNIDEYRLLNPPRRNMMVRALLRCACVCLFGADAYYHQMGFRCRLGQK